MYDGWIECEYGLRWGRQLKIQDARVLHTYGYVDHLGTCPHYNNLIMVDFDEWTWVVVLKRKGIKIGEVPLNNLKI